MHRSEEADRERDDALEQQINDFRDFLAAVEIVGYPRREAELAELERLISRYPDPARQILCRLTADTHRTEPATPCWERTRMT